MKFFAAVLIVLMISGLTACTMFTAWRSIPPPGGCEECHKVPISNNWQVSYRPANLSDERGREYFQTEEYNMPRVDKPAAFLDRRKVEEASCFDCHNAPNSAHKQLKGRFHH
jgi:hypothetical protein